MGNSAAIWTFAGILATACFTRGLTMRNDSSAVAELAWYTLGAFILVGASLLWISLEQKMLGQYKIVLGVIGAIFGGLALILIGEWIHSINQAKANQAKAYLSSTLPSANQKPEPGQPSALIINNMVLSNEQKKQLIKSFTALKPTTKSIVINRSSSTKNNLWSELANVFNRAGFGSVDGSVQTGFQESAHPDEAGVMICTIDPHSPSKIDALIKDVLEKIGIKSKYIPLSEAIYKGDITIFVGPDPL
jgi:hypothetical protein